MIKSITLSLLERDTTSQLVKAGEEPFIRRASAIIDIEKFLENPQDIFKNEHEFIQSSIGIFFDELQKNNDGSSTHVGIWIEKEDDVYTNSMKISLLEKMKEYGTEDLDPIFEFYKMTIRNHEEIS